MGRDKAVIEVEGEPLYARTARHLAGYVDEVVLAPGNGRALVDRRWRAVLDARFSPAEGAAAKGDDLRTAPREGPVAALVAGLELGASERFDALVLVACDLPCFTGRVVAPLVDVLASDPTVDVAHWTREGHDEPLCVAVRTHVVASVTAAFVGGVRRPVEVFARLARWRAEAPPELARELAGANTPDEFLALTAEPCASGGLSGTKGRGHGP